jgi:hypothetical protein
VFEGLLHLLWDLLWITNQLTVRHLMDF